MSIGEIEKERLSLDREKVQGELEVKRSELEIRKAELNKIWWRNPLYAGILAALLGLLGNIFATYQQGKNALLVEQTKNLYLQKQEDQKFKSNLIIEAIKTGDPENAAKNLKFMINIGLLDDPEGKISSYTTDTQKTPVLPISLGQFGCPGALMPCPDGKTCVQALEDCPK